ncbi:MAG: NUDIX domain-containing protein [Gammaproteobacteria bacterium]|jgi:8-oxo-dGTP pyrophosphatase MutT (NUDIX family)|nr:NUDIX domain-containing protein [Gammaproteobacteria bacterium]
MTDIPPARPASTVVLVRDSKRGMETLMLRRNKALMFAGGLWVFPGGSLDPQDYAEAADDTEEAAARIAAAREALEEAGVAPSAQDMVLLSHWTTPVVEPRRFSTWIYAAPLDNDDEVVIDGGEIHDSRWLLVADAVAAHEQGELGMLPPTYLTLCTLLHYDCVDTMVRVERASPVPRVFPVFGADGDAMTAMFRGDAGYDSADGAVPGARHRTVLRDNIWQYVYEGVDPAYPPLIPMDG